MRINCLQLEHFRSYNSLDLNFSKDDICIFVGENGAGKTNILESISILSLLRSCIGADEKDLVNWGKGHYRIRGAVKADSGEEKQLEVVSQQEPRIQKACFENDVKVSVEHMIGLFPTVVFLPQDLQLFTGAPAQRRKFLDRLLSQVSPEYLSQILQYQKVLKQRNSLLKRIAEGKAQDSELDLWDDQLALLAAPITIARLELIGTLQLTFPEEMRSLGEKTWSDIKLSYARKGEATNEAELRLEYRLILLNNRKRDCILQSTSVGPHREDWHVLVDGRSVDTFASRGQQRTSLLALLLLQVSYLELRWGEKPLILLDDVFSELDDSHQKCLLQSLRGYQVFMTTTKIPHGIENINCMKVEKGGKVLMNDQKPELKETIKA